MKSSAKQKATTEVSFQNETNKELIKEIKILQDEVRSMAISTELTRDGVRFRVASKEELSEIAENVIQIKHIATAIHRAVFEVLKKL